MDRTATSAPHNRVAISLLDSSTHSLGYNSVKYDMTRRFNFKLILSRLDHEKELESTLFRHSKDTIPHKSWYAVLNNPLYHTFVVCLSLLYWICRLLVLFEFYTHSQSAQSNQTFFWISFILSATSQLPMSAIACKYVSDWFHLDYYLTSFGALMLVIFSSILLVEIGPIVPICMYFMRRLNNFNHLDTAQIYECHRGFVYQALADALPQSVILTLKILQFGLNLKIPPQIAASVFYLYLSLLMCIIYIVLIIFVLCFLGVLYGNMMSSMCIFVVFTIDLLQLFVILIFLYPHSRFIFIWTMYILVAIGIPALLLSASVILLFTREVLHSINHYNWLIQAVCVVCLSVMAIVSITVLLIMMAIFSCGLSYIWTWIITMALNAPLYEIHPRGQFSVWVTEKNRSSSSVYKLCCLNAMIMHKLHRNKVRDTAGNEEDDPSKQYLLQHSTSLFERFSLTEFRRKNHELSIIARLDKEILSSVLIAKTEHKKLHLLQRYAVFWYIWMRIPNMFAPFIIVAYYSQFYQGYETLVTSLQNYLLLTVFLSLDILFIVIAVILFSTMFKRLYYGWHILDAKDSIYKQIKQELYRYLLLLFSKQLINGIINEQGIADIIIDYVGIHEL